MLKEEAIKNLQNQLDSQKKRLTTEFVKVQNELQAELDKHRKEVKHLKENEVSKDAHLSELTKHCSELIASRSISLNLVMNKQLPQSTPLKTANGAADTHKKACKAGATQKAGRSNLKLAMELNREMEEMLAENGI